MIAGFSGPILVLVAGFSMFRYFDYLDRRDKREAERRQAAVPGTPASGEPIHR